MLIYATQEEIDSYYSSDALNQSQLKKLLVGLDFLTSTKESDLYFEEKESFLIGSIVDFIITRGNEDITNYYYISAYMDKPSDPIKSIINKFIDSFPKGTEFKDLNSEEYTDKLFKIIEEHDYCKTFKREVRLAKIYAEEGYYIELINSKGKQIISGEEYNTALKVANSIKQLPLIKKCLEDYDTSEEVNIYFQKPLYFTFKGRKCKALPDIIIHFLSANVIYVIDIKTTFEKTLNFLLAIKKYRYDIQMAWYKEACKSIFNTLKISCLFAVESTSKQGNAIVLQLDKDLVDCGLNGLEEVYYEGMLLRREQLGINKLMDLYQYHEDNSFREEKIIAESVPYKVLKVGINKIH